MRPVLRRAHVFVLLVAAASLLGCKGAFREKRVTIPAGTTIAASLESRLGTGWNRSGDPFTATSVEALFVDGRMAVPVGSVVRGTVEGVESSGRVKGRARMTLVFNEVIDPTGAAHRLQARPVTFVAKSGTHDDLEKVAAGGITGAILGGLLGGKSGAVKGTALGAGAGTVWVLTTKGDEVELDQGLRLNVRMTGPLEIPLVAQNLTEGGE